MMTGRKNVYRLAWPYKFDSIVHSVVMCVYIFRWEYGMRSSTSRQSLPLPSIMSCHYQRQPSQHWEKQYYSESLNCLTTYRHRQKNYDERSFRHFWLFSFFFPSFLILFLFIYIYTYVCIYIDTYLLHSLRKKRKNKKAKRQKTFISFLFL